MTDQGRSRSRPGAAPSVDAATGPLEDFRVRTARTRRAHTSRRLYEATFEVIADRGISGLAVEDVRCRAELSRGAFYRYFPTLDALLDYLGSAVGAQLNAEMSDRFDGTPDAAARISAHLRYQIIRVMSDPPCAALVSRLISRDGAVSPFARDHAVRDFVETVGTGESGVNSADLAVAAELAHGLLSTILRAAIRDGLDRDRLAQQAAFLLRGCGLSPEAARRHSTSIVSVSSHGLREAVLDLCTAP